MAVSVGAVVLAGGRSSRMGTAKASLPWHGSTLLRRTVGVVGRAAPGPVVVVRAAGQSLPALPAAVELLEDSDQARGPLHGMAVGLAALAPRVEVALVCSTDLPFLHPAFLQRLLALRGDADVVLPVVRGFRQPLVAGYRTVLAGRATELLAQDRARPAFLLERSDVRVVEESELLADARLRAVDPGLDSVLGMNDPAEYEAACARPLPEVAVHRTGVLASPGGASTSTVRAASLGAAATAVGLRLDRHLLAAVNGDQVVRDVETPLVQGDAVTFLSADAGG